MRSPSTDAVLGAGLTCIVGGVVFFLWRGVGPALELRTDQWAAWVQAITGGATAIVAVWIVFHQRAERAADAQANLIHVIGQALYSTRVAWFKAKEGNREELEFRLDELVEEIRQAQAIDMAMLKPTQRRALGALIPTLIRARRLILAAEGKPMLVEVSVYMHKAWVDIGNISKCVHGYNQEKFDEPADW